MLLRTKESFSIWTMGSVKTKKCPRSSNWLRTRFFTWDEEEDQRLVFKRSKKFFLHQIERSYSFLSKLYFQVRIPAVTAYNPLNMEKRLIVYIRVLSTLFFTFLFYGETSLSHSQAFLRILSNSLLRVFIWRFVVPPT